MVPLSEHQMRTARSSFANFVWARAVLRRPSQAKKKSTELGGTPHPPFPLFTHCPPFRRNLGEAPFSLSADFPLIFFCQNQTHVRQQIVDNPRHRRDVRRHVAIRPRATTASARLRCQRSTIIVVVVVVVIVVALPVVVRRARRRAGLRRHTSGR